MSDKISPEELKQLMDNSFGTLTEREKKIISLRYSKEVQKQQTLQQIAAIYGLTRERIRQIIVKCIRKMRKYNERKNLKMGSLS